MDDIIRPGRRPEGSGSFITNPRTEGVQGPDSPRVHADIAGIAARRAPAPAAQGMHGPPDTGHQPAVAVETTPVGQPATATPLAHLSATPLATTIATTSSTPNTTPMAPSTPSSTPTMPVETTSSSPSTTPISRPVVIPQPSTPAAPEQSEATEDPSIFSASTPASTSTGDQKSSLLAEVENQGKTDADGKVRQAPSSPVKKKHNIAAVMIAVVMALGLIAGAGYAYWQNNKTVQTDPQTTPKTTTTSDQTKSTATADDVDSASKAIDDAIKSIDETKEFQATDLSDTTLGL